MFFCFAFLDATSQYILLKHNLVLKSTFFSSIMRFPNCIRFFWHFIMLITNKLPMILQYKYITALEEFNTCYLCMVFNT
jgi:hypothetical protein